MFTARVESKTEPTRLIEPPLTKDPVVLSTASPITVSEPSIEIKGTVPATSVTIFPVSNASPATTLLPSIYVIIVGVS